VAELTSRLQAKGYPVEIVDAIVAHLVEKSLLDDQRVIERVVEQLLAKPGAGRLKVKARLLSRGLDEGVADRALAEISDEDQIRSALDTFVGRPFLEDQTRAYRHLANRGFEEEIIEAALLRYYRESGSA